MRGSKNRFVLGSAFVAASAFVASGFVAACGHSAPAALGGHVADPSSAIAQAPSGPPQYLVADPSPQGTTVTLPLGGAGSLGLVVDRARIVVGRGEPHVAGDAPETPIVGAARVPARLKGGFLFWTDAVVYRASTFDGRLEPVARFAGGIQGVAFAARSVVVRTRNGERWGLGLPGGERIAVEPAGAVDVQALDDGRALAFDADGAVYASTDAGGHWSAITAHVKSTPERVAVIDDELWLLESGGGAVRLEADGRIASFDKSPEAKPLEMRPRDPRWRGTDAPLRSVFHNGAAVDDTTALVVEQGDLVRVDVRTGEIVSTVVGRLPPDARCQAVPTANDVLFACVSRAGGAAGYGNATSFVVSHTLSGDAPVIEQSFGATGGFFASDDGGLAFAGSCSGGAATSGNVCVRQPGGTWQEYDVSGLATDAGTTMVSVARWVPRADGHAVALVSDPLAGIYDPRSGSFEELGDDAREVIGGGSPVMHGARFRRPHGFMGRLVDDAWTFSPTGSLRAWARGGGAIEIVDRRLTRSPYVLDLATSGARALGRTKEGRFYQSTDHGATWTEVAAPPSGAAGGELRDCSSAGCDLGGFYRVGWAVRPPRPEAPVEPARPAPDVRRTAPVELACRPMGPAQTKVLRRTDVSPEDLGLGGAMRLPTSSERAEVELVRVTLPRGIVHPLHDPPMGDSDNPALRALLSGPGTTHDSDIISVAGPNKNPAALRRTLSFVPAFDPGAPVRRATIAMSDVIAVGRAAGMTTEEILADDMTESGEIVMVTPQDPNGASDLAFHNARGLVAHVRANERVRLAMRLSAQNEATLVSGVSLAADEAAFLELEGTGAGHVFKAGPPGVTDLFDVSAALADPALYPANPDALAIGPRGDLAVVRTPSGSDPPSVADPALLLVPGQPPAPLAPWSTLRFADDVSCKEPGYRTTLQVIAPWIRVVAPELRVEDVPMLARVKWNDKRVCLEGVEVKLPDVSVRVPGTGGDVMRFASWLVSRGSSFARIAVSEGIEWRQPLECSRVAAPVTAARAP